MSLLGCQQRWEVCIRTVCLCMHVLVYGEGWGHESSEPQLGRNTHSLPFSVCTCVSKHLSVRGVTLLQRANVLEVTSRRSGKRSSLLRLYEQKQAAVVEPCHWRGNVYSNMSGNQETHASYESHIHSNEKSKGNSFRTDRVWHRWWKKTAATGGFIDKNEKSNNLNFFLCLFLN